MSEFFIPNAQKPFYEEGKKAFRDGLKLLNCPYEDVGDAFMGWRAGYIHELFEDAKRNPPVDDGGDDAPQKTERKRVEAERRGDFCDDAKKTITQDRNNIHGEPENVFGEIADVWNWYLRSRGLMADGVAVDAAQVADMMELFKIARGSNGNYNRDNFVDRIGYAAIAGELAAAKKNAQDRQKTLEQDEMDL